MNKSYLIFTIGGAQAFEEIGSVSKLYNHLVHTYADGKECDPFNATLNEGLVEGNIGDHKVFIADASLGDANGHLEEYFRYVVLNKVEDENHYITAQALETMKRMGNADPSTGFVFDTKHNELVITPLNALPKHEGE